MKKRTHLPPAGLPGPQPGVLPSAPPAPTEPCRAAAATRGSREQRLASALRANLARRKQAVRAPGQS